MLARVIKDKEVIYNLSALLKSRIPDWYICDAPNLLVFVEKCTHLLELGKGKLAFESSKTLSQRLKRIRAANHDEDQFFLEFPHRKRIY